MGARRNGREEEAAGATAATGTATGDGRMSVLAGRATLQVERAGEERVPVLRRSDVKDGCAHDAFCARITCPHGRTAWYAIGAFCICTAVIVIAGHWGGWIVQ